MNPFISNWCLRLAPLYLVVGVGLGIMMSATHDYALKPLHVHINLVGWVCIFLFGLFYRAFPAAAQHPLAKVHFWLFVPGSVVQMLTLGMLLKGNTSIEPVLAAASVAVGVAILCFTAVVWKFVGRSGDA